MVNFVFYPSKLKKKFCLLIISKSRGAKAPLPPLPMPMLALHVYLVPCAVEQFASVKSWL